MAFISILEIIDIIIMTLAIGFIFKDWFKKPIFYHDDPIGAYHKQNKFINWDDFKFAIIVTAPAIIFHEFGHKFAAIVMGLYATFHAAYTWLGLGIVLKLVGAPFVFFVPAYVAHSAAALPWQSALIAFAGPAVNLLLWLGAAYILKTSKRTKKLSHTTFVALELTKKINMFLFIFNMIPIPGFDGWHVFSGLYGMFF
ncbi:MAG: M50 family metallopeptidase [Candidatus Woesearchaeota archaeon]